MITVDMVLDEAGLLRSCRVEGHAGKGPTGGDVVCAAVSVLVRTALRVLSQTEGITVRGGAPRRGSSWMEADYSGEKAEFLSGVTACLSEGLVSVAHDYPDYCDVRIRTERRE